MCCFPGGIERACCSNGFPGNSQRRREKKVRERGQGRRCPIKRMAKRKRNAQCSQAKEKALSSQTPTTTPFASRASSKAKLFWRPPPLSPSPPSPSPLTTPRRNSVSCCGVPYTLPSHLVSYCGPGRERVRERFERPRGFVLGRPFCRSFRFCRAVAQGTAFNGSKR